jgi:hypothetical protein
VRRCAAAAEPHAGRSTHVPSVSGILTTFLAIWGAVVSTIAIVWNVRRDLVDRGKLRVVCYRGGLRGGYGPPDPKTYLVYNVTNVGRRPVIVTNLGGARNKKTHFVISTRSPLPRTLQHGEYFMECSDLSIMDEQPEALWAVDSLNRYWKFPRRALRRLIREHESKRDVV